MVIRQLLSLIPGQKKTTCFCISSPVCMSYDKAYNYSCEYNYNSTTAQFFDKFATGEIKCSLFNTRMQVCE